MLFNIIEFTSSELNSGAIVKKDVPDTSLPTTEGYDKSYSPTEIKVKNATNGAFSYGLFTDLEYGLFVISGSAYSDLVSIANSSTDTIQNIRGQITSICVSGSSAHNASAQFIITQQ
jgi:hypothetical protein